MLKRVLYLGYYFKEMDWEKFRRFSDFASVHSGMSKASLWRDMLSSCLRYNISPLEYFYFRFYKLQSMERSNYAGTGYMYEYQLTMNPKANRNVLEDKGQFLQRYRSYVRHSYVSLAELEENPNRGKEILSNSSGKVVLKSVDGQCGRGIEIRPTSEFNVTSMISRMKESGNDLAEEYVLQHPALNALSPSGLNTLRVITQINDRGDVDILGARLRITVNSAIDNLAAGNLAAEVDLQTGKVSAPAVYSDITKQPESHHPITGVAIVGFELPLFADALSMVKAAALSDPSNRSIGWDVAITEQGVELIEGNHDWCKLLWQLPVHRGLKPILEAYR